METNSNNSIANEIDAIIARAIEEYRNAKGIDAFAEEAPANLETLSDTPDPTNDTPAALEDEEVATPVEEIPVNSRSILVSEETSRFSDAIWFNNIQSKEVCLAGVGGIGSYVAFLLSRLHPNVIALYDDDYVEAANMSGQLYSGADVGNSKVNAMVNMMNTYSHYYNIMAYRERFTRESPPSKVMICGFDNMDARKMFFESWVELVRSLPQEERKECLFIDGRLAAEQFQVLCIRGDDTFNMRRYVNEFLFKDSDAEETICSYKQTTFMANMIGSVMVNLFVNFCANECNPLIPRDLPFYTEYSAETMYFKVIA